MGLTDLNYLEKWLRNYYTSKRKALLASMYDNAMIYSNTWISLVRPIDLFHNAQNSVHFHYFCPCIPYTQSALPYWPIVSKLNEQGHVSTCLRSAWDWTRNTDVLDRSRPGLSTIHQNLKLLALWSRSILPGFGRVSVCFCENRALLKGPWSWWNRSADCLTLSLLQAVWEAVWGVYFLAWMASMQFVMWSNPYWPLCNIPFVFKKDGK